MNEQTQQTPKRPRRMAREPRADAGQSEAVGITLQGVETRAPAAAGRDAVRPGSKIATVIALLQRPEGATLAELIEATGWLPHTARAALTGLRKKGHAIVRDKREDVTCYRIGGAG